MLLEGLAQSCASTGQPAFYRADVYIEDLGDLFVPESLYLPQYNYFAINLR